MLAMCAYEGIGSPGVMYEGGSRGARRVGIRIVRYVSAGLTAARRSPTRLVYLYHLYFTTTDYSYNSRTHATKSTHESVHPHLGNAFLSCIAQEAFYLYLLGTSTSCTSPANTTLMPYFQYPVCCFFASTALLKYLL